MKIRIDDVELGKDFLAFGTIDVTEAMHSVQGAYVEVQDGSTYNRQISGIQSLPVSLKKGKYKVTVVLEPISEKT